MRPRKAKEFISPTAIDLNMAEDVVKDIIKYYWTTIRKNISSLSHARIHVTNLGDFNIKHWKIDSKLVNLEKFEKENTLKGNHLINARFKMAETLYELRNIKKVIEEETQRKEFIQLHKKTKYGIEAKSNKNMEE